MMCSLTWSALPSQSCRTWKPSWRVLRSYLPIVSARSIFSPPAFHAWARMSARSRRSAWVKSFEADAPARISRRTPGPRTDSTSAHAPSKETAGIRPGLGGGWRGAELLEGRRQLGRDRQRVAVLDLAALEHVDDLAVAHQRDGGRRGAVAGEILARAIGRFDVGPREHRRGHSRLHGVAQREGDPGARLAGGAAAHRVDHDHERSGGAGHCGIDVPRRPQLAEAEVGQLLAHRRHEELWIRHT